MKSTAINNGEQIVIRPYSTKELAAGYNICNRTFLNWLKPFKEQLGARQGRFYSISQVKIIFQCLGIPGYESENGQSKAEQ